MTRKSSLTDRQYCVLVGLAEGMSSLEIARRLSLSRATVQRTASEVFHNLGGVTPESGMFNSRALVSRAFQVGAIGWGLHLNDSGLVVKSVSRAVRGPK